jgi:PPOX class probable F420-dependent enzyme
MEPSERDAFLRGPHTAVLSTLGRDGRVHAVPVWYLYEGGVFRILTGRGSVKHRNVERTGRATLCVDQRSGGFRYVTAEGPVTIDATVSREERLALHVHYRGPDDARRVVDRGGHEGLVRLTLTPERWLG